MKICERMVSRANDEVDLFLVDIRLLAVEADLPTSLIVLAFAGDHGEIAVRCLVMEWPSEFGDMFRPQTGERPPHTGFPETGRTIGMAAGADGRIHVRIYGIRRRLR